MISLEMLSICLLKGSRWPPLSSMQPPRHRADPEALSCTGFQTQPPVGIRRPPLQRASEPITRTKASPRTCPTLFTLTATPAKTTTRLEGGSCLMYQVWVDGRWLRLNFLSFLPGSFRFERQQRTQRRGRRPCKFLWPTAPHTYWFPFFIKEALFSRRDNGVLFIYFL